jgi:DNA-binding response OmpR family regulator
MKKILIIEDDRSIAELVRDYLEAEGFECSIVEDGNLGQEEAQKPGWDLIILDLMLPGSSGFAICRSIRESSEIPVILMSARKDDIDKIRGLGLGADDYVTKPFSPAELTARAKAHLARYERLRSGGKSGGGIAIRGIEIDPDSRKVSVTGRNIGLTAKEFDLLHLFMSNPERVFTKEEIFQRIWEDSFGDLSTVTVHVRKLREKIEDDPSAPEYIETVWGVGYRFTP